MKTQDNGTFVHEGKNYRVFTCHAFGSEHRCILVPGFYRNGTLAIRVLDINGPEENAFAEPFGVLTVNHDDNRFQTLTDAYIKTYTENEGWALELAAQAGECICECISDRGIDPLYRFDISTFTA